MVKGVVPRLCVLVWACVTLSCQESQPSRLKEIHELERQAFDGAELRPEVRQALLVKYADFARLEGGHAFVPEALFRRADLLISAGKFDEAILQLQDVHDGYPTFDKRSLCAFLVAFIYDEHLKDRELAIRAYERTMALHPDSPEFLLAQQSLSILQR